MLTVGMAISWKLKQISSMIMVKRFWKNVMMTIEEFKSKGPALYSKYLCNLIDCSILSSGITEYN
jgi:hypothetical protein